jgi:type VI secretion system secreted protein VgrG
VPPAETKPALAADLADPGLMAKIKAEERQSKSGKYGETPIKSNQDDDSTSDNNRQEKTWIEIELVDAQKNPVAGEKYKITLPDGTAAEGTLDEKGLARVEEIEPGTCQITFPNLDKDAWKPL